MTKQLLKNNQLLRSPVIFLLYSIMLTFIPALGFAQGKVSGMVKDNAGNPLGNVSVVVKSTTRGTTTDGSGHFLLQPIQRMCWYFLLQGMNRGRW